MSAGVLPFATTPLQVRIRSEKMHLPVCSTLPPILRTGNVPVKMVCRQNPAPCQRQNEECWGSLQEYQQYLNLIKQRSADISTNVKQTQPLPEFYK